MKSDNTYKFLFQSTTKHLPVLAKVAAILVSFSLVFEAQAQNKIRTSLVANKTPAKLQDGVLIAKPEGKPVELFGVFHVVRGISENREDEIAAHYFVSNKEGELQEVYISDSVLNKAGGVNAIAGKHVMLNGTKHESSKLVKVGLVTVKSGRRRSQARNANIVSGSVPWATLLCRFADSPDITPETPTWFNTLMGSSYPGMNHYWSETSYGNINIDGSQVFGWYNLPANRDEYIISTPDGETANLANLLKDCAAVADPDVDFRNFQGINLMFNERLDDSAWGGSGGVLADGVNKVYRVTWMPPWGFRNQDVMGQEMGHGLGLPHSSGPYSSTYDSQWDVMSRGGTCLFPDPEYGCIGVHTIAFHKDLLGWIPSSRKYVPNKPGSTTIELDRLAQATSSNYLMAQIPIGNSSTKFYTVESRLFAGYDEQIPGEAVVIHKVDTLRNDRNAQVVDTDGNPNDEGAMWRPGETFTDPDNEISVRINNDTATGHSVTITVGGRTLRIEMPNGGHVVGNGIDCFATCEADFLFGTRVTLRGLRENGSRLEKWTGCSPNGTGTSCTLFMNSDRQVTAEFGIADGPGTAPICDEWLNGNGNPPPHKVEELCGVEL